MFAVIAYDVASDRRRMRLHTLLLRYGTPVQESVFECEVEQRDLQVLRRQISRIIRPSVDKLRLYSLCRNCVERIEDESGEVDPAPEVLVV